MAEDWLADVRKYAKDADEAVVGKLVRYLGIALRNRDSALVSFSDAKETGRVRENFLKKKLALTAPDATLDAAIAAVGARMKADRTKNRVTVYYLLAEQFGKLDVFGGSATAPKAAAVKPRVAKAAAPQPPKGTAVKPAAAKPRAARPAGRGTAPKATVTSKVANGAPPVPPAPPPAPPASPPVGTSGTTATRPQPMTGSTGNRFHGGGADSGGSRWWLWLLIALGIMAIFAFLKTSGAGRG